MLGLRLLLSTEIARAVCLGDFFSAPEPAKAKILWDGGVYDASVAVFTTDTKLDAAAARSSAEKSGHPEARSYAFGACPGDAGKKSPAISSPKSWLAIFTASAPAQLNGLELVLSEEVRKFCPNWLVRSAGRQGSSQNVAEKLPGRWLLPDADGIVTVTCSHDDAARASDRGPELWYSIPTGKGPAPEVPHRNILSQKADHQKSALLTWINALRQDNGLGQLKEARLPGAPDLTAIKTPFHDRKALEKIRKVAHSGKLKLVLSGENRVLARTEQDAAWLWWNSPRHRDLLIKPEATHALIQTRAVGHSLIVSLVLFSEPKAP